jgi:mono/diheme cytochrome c family protein
MGINGLQNGRFPSRFRELRTVLTSVLGLALALGLGASAAAQEAALDPDKDRGAYLFAAAGCRNCHTDVKNKGAPLAGGRAMETPFGTFYTPNITPDTETGIGGWSDEDFVRALRDGVSPAGDHLYPAFPYTSYTRMSEDDMRALKAYIFSLPPVRQENRAHELDFPFGWRFLLGAWKMLNFTPGAMAPESGRSESWNRGAYLVEALGHCGECHTPRDALGGLDGDRRMAGTTDGPDGEKVPNITPDESTGIGAWSTSQITGVLRTGLLPDGDVVGSVMGEVVNNGTSRLTDADRAAIAEYLQSLPAIANSEARATQPDY